MNVVITGASRGIGLGFVCHYLSRGAHVWGCYRAEPGGLAGLKDDRLRTVQWDVTTSAPPGGVSGAGFPERIDLLINNAGIYGPDKQGGQSLENVTPETMLQLFDVNCVGALRVAQELRPGLVEAGGKIANVSSKMGSITDNSSGGCYAYRASKAALVAVSRSLAIDLAHDGVRVITLHPGWVKTDMTRHSGLIDVETSVQGMAEVIDGIDNYCPGAFVAFDGRRIPY